MGNPSSSPTSIVSNVFQSGAPVSFSGTADVRNTTPSSGYSGASGGGNILINNSGEFFQISGINTSAYSNVKLSFGIFKSTNASDGSDLIVEYSTDGSSYSSLSYSLPTGSGSSSWYLKTFTSIPSAINLRIRFKQTGNNSSNNYRIDDVVLSQYSTIVPPNDLCNNAQSITPNGSCINGTNFNATDDWLGNIGCQVGNADHPDVWYSFTATGTQAIVSTNSSGTFSGNIEVTLFSGTCPNGLTIIGYNCGASPLNSTFNGLTVGTTYYYMISSTSSGSGGPFQTCVTNSTPPVTSGQDCSTAAILCNGDLFTQTTSNQGYGVQEVTPSNSCFGLVSGSFLGERQSKWFKFTIGVSGSLRFNINPNNPNDDYDWAIWDVTNGCTLGLQIMAKGCNWEGGSGSNGSTGACTNSNACKNLEPGKLNNTHWQSPISVFAGNTYALLVDNFSTSNSGFTLKFGGAGGNCSLNNAVIGPNSDFTYSKNNCAEYTFSKTYSTSNSTFLWNFGDGVTSNFQNPTHTYTSSGLVTVTLTVTDALGCTSTSSKTFTVSVPTLSLTASSQVTCFSSSAQVLYLPFNVVAGVPDKYSITWNSIPANSFVSVTNASLPSSPINLNIPGNTTAGLYSGMLSVTDNSGCASVSIPFSVTVNPLPSLSLSSNILNSCFSSNAQTLNLPYTSTTESPSLYSITWNSSPINSLVNIVDGLLPSSPILLSIPANNPSGNYIGNLSVKNDNGCESNPISITVTINATSVSGTAAAANSSVCSGSATTITLTGNTGAIQWQQSSDGFSGWANVTVGAGATTSTYTTPNLTSTTYYRAVVTSGVCTSANSNSAAVTVNATSIAGTAAAANSSVCSGSATTITLTGNTGTIQWQQSSDGVSGWADVTFGSGATTSTYITPNLTSTTYYRAVVTSGVCVSANSNTATVNVNSNPSAPSAVGASRCGTGIVTLTAIAPTGGAIDWYDAPTSGTLLSSLLSYTTPILNTSTTYYVAYTSSLADGQCVSLSRTPVIATINSNPSAPSVTGASRCSTGTVTFSATPPAGGTVEWYDASTGGNLLSILPSYTTSLLTATATFYVSSISSLANGECASASRTPVIATINSNPSPPSVTGASRCSTGVVVLTASPPSGETVDWYDVSSGGSVLTSGGGVTTFTTPSISATSTYYTEARNASSGCLSATRTQVIATVNPKPIIPAQSANICSGQTFFIAPYNDPANSTIVPAGTTYTWTVAANPNVSGQSAAASPLSTISQTLTSISTSLQPVNYSVTPSAAGCNGSVFTARVLVNPNPSIPSLSVNVCSGTPFSVAPVNGIPTSSTVVPFGTKYTWSVIPNAIVSGENAQSILQTTISDTLVNNSSTPQLIQYDVTAETPAFCTATFTTTVTINPLPVFSLSNPSAVCEPSTINLSALPEVISGSSSGLTFGYFSDALATNALTSAQYTAVNTSGTYYIKSTNLPYSCTLVRPVSITVNPMPVINTPDSIAVCSAAETINIANPVLFIGSTPGQSFLYYLNAAATNVYNTPNLADTGVYYIKGTLASSTGCSAVKKIKIWLKNSPPAPAVTTPIYLCQNDQGVAPLSASGVFPLRWYTLPVGGVSNAIAPRPSTAFDGLFKYYVSQIDTPCASPRSVIWVKVFKKPNLGPDKELKVCYGASVDLDTVFNFTNLTNGWYLSNGTPVDNPNAVSAAGTYEVFVADSANCQDDAKVNIVILPKVTADARDSGIAILNTPHQLYGNGNGNQFEWSPSNYLNFSTVQNPIAILTTDTKFYLTVTNSAGCKAYDTLLVKVLSNPGSYIPKAFTPNGDGLNDRLTITPVGIQKLNYFRIYNRFGEKIFETTSLAVGWDGTFKGKKQEQDSYVYVLSAVYQKGETMITKGTVVLIR